jgi:lysozyme family protein
MANFNEGLKLVYKAEYNNDPKKALHQVQGEEFMTYKGINRKAWPNWEGWKIIDKYITEHKVLSKASPFCDADPELEKLTQIFYKKYFWNPNKLDQLTYQHTADEIFTTGVLTHPKTAAKFAQKVVGLAIDGVIGPVSIKKLNEFDWKLFDKKYDEAEINHYMDLIKANSKFKQYEKGWKNRAVAI